MFHKLLACLILISSLVAPKEMTAQGKSSNVGGNSSNAGSKSSNAGGNSSNAGSKSSNAGGNSSNAGSKSSNAGAKSSNAENRTKGLSKKQNIASELKALNAAKANLSALINSNEKSQIGKISLYKESAKETLAAKDKYTLILMDLESSVTVWKEAKEDYDNYSSAYDGRSPEKIQVDLDSLDINSETYQTDLARLTEEKSVYNTFVDQANALAKLVNDNVDMFEAKQESLDLAEQDYSDAQLKEQSLLSNELGSPDLSEDALSELRSLLGL
jgi:hypothetical protein